MATNRENIYIPLEDVESEHCALIVEKGLAQVKGVETHKVELNNRRAAITVDSNETVGEAVKAIKDLGYGVPTVKSAFPVLGMTCASCAGSAESIVKYQPGVVNASVNFATGNLTVEYLPNMTDASTLQKAVQGVGYDLLIEDETKQQETLEAIHEKKFRTFKNKTIWAIILSLPVVISICCLPTFGINGDCMLTYILKRLPLLSHSSSWENCWKKEPKATPLQPLRS